MAAKEQLTAMEMIWGFMSGTTGHMGKTDFEPQKEAFGDFASPETYFPRVVPESEGISSEKLTQMLRELAAARHTDMHHLLVLRNGHVICECNFAPYRSGIWHATYSMCKSITGMAAGFLISEGKLSLDENVYDIFEKRNGLLQKILRPNLTVKHLLTMKSGVQFNEMGVVSGNDWVDSFLNAPVKGTPGEAFEYNSMNTYLLSAIIQERTGMKMVDYLRPRLFEPLGIRKVFWESCPAGITKGGWGLFLCPEDAAKLGVMLGAPAAPQVTDALGAAGAGAFWAAGVERIAAMALHMALSILVWMAVTRRVPIWYYFAAVLLHAAANIPAALSQLGLLRSMWCIEGIILAVNAAVCLFVWSVYRKACVHRPLAG